MSMIANVARKAIDAAHGADDEGGCALPPRVTQAEVGPDRPTEGCVRESKGVAPLCHVVEGDLASIIVQENAHPLEGGPQGEGSHRGGESPVLLPVPQGHCPESVLGGRGDSAFPAHGVFADTYGPLGFISHLYLPVMSPSDEARRAQHTGEQIEPLGVVRQVLLEVTVPHLPQVIGEDQAGVGRVWVQGHVHCGDTGETGRSAKGWAHSGGHPARVPPPPEKKARTPHERLRSLMKVILEFTLQKLSALAFLSQQTCKVRISPLLPFLKTP